MGITEMKKRVQPSRIVILAVVIAAIVGALATSTATSVADEGEPPSPVNETEVSVDPALEGTDGERELVVRFTEASLDVDDRTAPPIEDFEERSTTAQRSFEAFAAETDGVEIERKSWLANAVLVTVDTDDVALADLGAVDGVARIHDNFDIEPPAPVPVRDEPDQSASVLETASESPNVTDGIERIRAAEVWEEYGTRGDGVAVAVLDTGVDAGHPDIELADGDWAEFDRSGNATDSEPYDVNGHGTHVSGTVAGGNASGTSIGVAPDATLMHGGVLTPEGGSFMSLVAGMEWAVENDADVISMSVGETGYHDEFVEPIRMATAAGVVVVASSGNSGDGSSDSPGNVYETFAVGATDDTDDIYYNPPYGTSSGEVVDTDEAWADPPSEWPEEYVVPDVTAPGVDVKSAAPGGGYSLDNGTSMAAPHVAGAVALVLSENPELTPDEVTGLFETTTTKPAGEPAEQDTRYGHGIIDIYDTMELASNATTVSGTVTNADEEPLESVTVESALGQSAVTDANGTYALAVPTGERTIVASGFGVESNETTVDVSGDALEHDIVVETVPDAELASDAPSQVLPGESYDVEVRVSDVDALTITRNGTGTLANATLEGGFDFGTEANVSDLDRGDTVTATVVTDPAEVGSLSLTFEFGTETNESIAVTTTTSVLADPITVGTDGDAATVQDALDIAHPGMTIRLLDNEYEIDVTDGPIVVDTPVTLTAADSVDPVLSVTADAASEFDSGLFVTADNVTVSGITIAGNGTTDGISIVEEARHVRLVNNTVDDVVYGVWIGRGSTVELIGNDVTGFVTAVDVWGTADAILENRLESETTDLSLAFGGEAGTVSDNEFAGNGTGIRVGSDGSAATISDNRFAGDTGVDVSGDVASSGYNDFAAVETTAIRANGPEFISELDYYGERGPESDDIVGPVEYEPFATVPPSNLSGDPADVQQFGSHLELPADEPTAASFPGPMANDLETTFGEFNGTIYEFDSERDGWDPIDDGSETPNALDTYVVVPEENVTVLVEFETSDEPGIPGEADVDAGWNLIGAPAYDDAEDAYAATSAAPSRILHLIGAPGGQPVESETEDGDDWLRYTFGSETNEPTVSPYTGYFVYANQDGSVAANAYPGITLGETDELLGFSEARFGVSDETPSVRVSEIQNASTAVNASS